MLTATGRAAASSRSLQALVLFVAAGVAGCSRAPSAQDQLEAAFRGSSAKQLKVAKFEGQVTIDGQPPGSDYTKLHIVLVEADKYQEPNRAQRWQADVAPDGSFSFTTYIKDDGAPVGKYVAVFVDPSLADDSARTSAPRAGRGMRLGGSQAAKDRLKNLYNDPEVNSKNPDFLITLAEPGITNQHFNLEVSGKEGRSPGQYAVRDVSTTDAVFKFSRR
jgi:hypothetical protein